MSKIIVENKDNEIYDDENYTSSEDDYSDSDISSDEERERKNYLNSNKKEEEEKEEEDEDEEYNYKKKKLKAGNKKTISNKKNVDNSKCDKKIKKETKKEMKVNELLEETDEMGFLISETNKIEKKTDKDFLRENARTEKWIHMLNHFSIYYNENYNKLKSRTRKGIPDGLRSQVWQIFAKINKFKGQISYNKIDTNLANKKAKDDIEKDINRTFPCCTFFKDYYDGAKILNRVLLRYSIYNKKVGYAQGLNFLVASFLLYMNEESAFLMLHSLMVNYGLEYYYKDMKNVNKLLYVFLNLMKKFIPELYEILKKKYMFPGTYALQWFLTLFAINLEFKVFVRFLDIFLLEGEKVIYRFGLGFLKLIEKDMLPLKDSSDFILIFFDKLYKHKIEDIFKVPFKFKFTRKHINKLKKKYEELKKTKTKDEFMEQLDEEK